MIVAEKLSGFMCIAPAMLPKISISAMAESSVLIIDTAEVLEEEARRPCVVDISQPMKTIRFIFYHLAKSMLAQNIAEAASGIDVGFLSVLAE